MMYSNTDLHGKLSVAHAQVERAMGPITNMLATRKYSASLARRAVGELEAAVDALAKIIEETK